ncbi:MAG: glycosyltransferase family 2 protein [Bacteroidales bacterium]|jgi:glycosyltransferase involved in cell wall biosynthesis|nr:glycosyltransferase family 2 protein [Bacteroidales bacterium]
MKKISATIITYNEEKNIRRCLESLQGVADEIVVVDSFSKDKTREICQQYNVHFFERPFKNYSDQKNFAIEQTRYELVLSIDADEEISDTLKKSIINVKENNHSDGYYFNRITNYCGRWIKHSGWYPNHQLRLWKKAKGKWVGIIHESLSIPKTSCTHIQGDLFHYSYENFSQHLLKIDKFTDFQAREMFDKQKRTTCFHIVVKPFLRFFRHYFLKLGFLDGLEGFIISIHSAYGQFLKYIKLRHLYKNAG